MASTNKTPNLGLNQWLLTDPFQVEDFNADNALLDAALATVGNCKFAYGTYTGTDTCGPNAPTTLTFDFAPKLVLIKQKDTNTLPTLLFAGDSVAKSIAWIFGGGDLTVSTNGNSISWYHTGNTWSANSSSGGSATPFYQLNEDGAMYFYAAFG